MTRDLRTNTFLFFVLSVVFGPVYAALADTPRILIVGDSWAHSIATMGRAQKPGDVPGFGSLKTVLTRNGFAGVGVRGEKTAWGGRRADQWATPEYLEYIREEIAEFPTLDIVLLCIGGNDFLRETQKPEFPSLSPEERAARWVVIEKNIQTIVDFCISQRPDVRVILYDYDFLDTAAMTAAYKFDFHGISTRAFNEALVELSRRKLAIARRTERCAYVQNFGALQRAFGENTNVAEPGGPPDYDPFPGGDLDATMPKKAHVGDGVHPTAAAHEVMLERALVQFIRAWLSNDAANGIPAKDEP